jgi:3-hydroxyisobutyrate dehydrogenase-like beta-hydroxyacid dehydrogenase
MQVGIIGLGRMGANMARRLMQGGHGLRWLTVCRPPGHRWPSWSAGGATPATGGSRSAWISPVMSRAPRS